MVEFNLGDIAKGPLNKLKTLFGFGEDSESSGVFDIGSGDGENAHAKDLDRILSQPSDRKDLLIELEKMADSAVLDQILTIYADDITGGNAEGGGDIWVTGEDDSVVEEANKLLQERGVVENFWSTAFFTSLYGDEFYPLDSDDSGIQNVDFTSHPSIFRRFQESSQLIGWLIDYEDEEMDVVETLGGGKKKVQLDPPWKVAHIKAGTAVNQKFKKKGVIEGGYGKSVLEKKILDFKKLNLMENSMVLSRYTKSRRPMLLWVSVDGINSEEKQKTYFQSIQNRIRFSQSFSEGEEFESISQMFSVSEPVILPSIDGKERVVKQDLSESPNVESIIDVEYVRDRFFGTVKIPSAFLGLEEKSPSNLSESILTNMSIRYARTISRRQMEILQGFKRMIRIHFAHKGNIISPNDINVHTTEVTTAEDKSRAEIARDLVSTFEKIGSLFNRTVDVDYDEETFARHIIDQLNLPGLTAQDLFEEKQAQQKDKSVLENAIKKFKPRVKEYDKRSPLPTQGEEYNKEVKVD